MKEQQHNKRSEGIEGGNGNIEEEWQHPFSCVAMGAKHQPVISYYGNDYTEESSIGVSYFIQLMLLMA